MIYGRDLTVGSVYRLGDYEVTAQEIVDFATKWDPQGFHVDAEIAEAGAYGGLIASGLHTMAIYQRLSVLGIYGDWAVIAGRRITDIAFLRPVRPGDVLGGTVTLTDVEFGVRGRAVATLKAELTQQDGKRVVTAVSEVVVVADPPPDGVSQ